MKIPSFKRLYYTDFSAEYQKLIEQLSYTINNSIESIYSVLTNNVSLRDNMLVSVRDVTIMTDSSGSPQSTTAFNIDNSNPIDGLMVINYSNLTNSTVFPTSGITVSYVQSGAKVTIANVTGLVPNNVYSLRIVAFLT